MFTIFPRVLEKSGRINSGERLTEWKPRTHTRARKGGKLSKDRLPPSRLTPSAVGDRKKVYSIFSKIAAEPPRRVALARAKSPPRPQTTEMNIK